MAIESEVFSDDARIGVKAAVPIAVTNQDSSGPIYSFFLRCEFATEGRRNTPDLEKTSVNPSASDFFRQRAGGLRNILGVVTGESLERRVEASPIVETSGCH